MMPKEDNGPEHDRPEASVGMVVAVVLSAALWAVVLAVVLVQLGIR